MNEIHYFTSPEFEKAAERFQNREDRFLLFGNYDIWKSRKDKSQDNRKWAWIRIGNTDKLVFVDNKTMKAYKSDGYNST